MHVGANPPRECRISSKKAWALLAYLAMQSGRQASRTRLATLLWGDTPDAHARHSLRQCLVSLRQDLGTFAADVIEADLDAIRLRPTGLTIDAQEFLASAGTSDLERLAHAAALYGGPFLDGLDVESQPFDDWLSGQRAQIEEAAARIFEASAQASDRLGRVQEAIESINRLTAIDPLREAWQRNALRIYARHLGREAALSHAAKFTARLRDELGVQPEPATLSLIEQIKRNGAGSSHVTGLPVAAIGQASDGSNSEKAFSPRDRRFSLTLAASVAAFVFFAYEYFSPGRNSGWDGSPEIASTTRLASARDDGRALAAQAIVPIVVLPFAAASGLDSPDQVTADIISEELINRLSRFHEMRVIARQTAWFYRGKPVDVAAAGVELGIRYAVEGGVRTQGKLLRVNVQLIDATNRLQVWSDIFEREDADLIAVQDEIVKGLARGLQIHVTQAQGERLDDRVGEPAVAVLVAKAQAARYRGRTLDNLTEALGHYEEAYQRDPELLPAMVGLAATLIEMVSNSLVGDSAAYGARAEALLQQALQRNAGYAGAHYQLGLLHSARGQHQASVQSFRRALEFNPSLPYAHGNLAASLTRMGRANEAMEHLRYAMRLSPKDPSIGFWYLYAGETELELGNTTAAIEWLQRALPHMQGNPLVHGWLAATYSLQGDQDRAAQHLAQFKSAMPPDRFERWKENVRRNLEQQGVYHRRLFDGLAMAFAAAS